jgi:hypothetical protein
MSRLPTVEVEEADAPVVREVFGRVDAQAAAALGEETGGPTSSTPGRPERLPRVWRPG